MALHPRRIEGATDQTGQPISLYLIRQEIYILFSYKTIISLKARNHLFCDRFYSISDPLKRRGLGGNMGIGGREGIQDYSLY
jgi:hypothetical protein